LESKGEGGWGVGSHYIEKGGYNIGAWCTNVHLIILINISVISIKI
jgi:hypothetical protein